MPVFASTTTTTHLDVTVVPIYAIALVILGAAVVLVIARSPHLRTVITNPVTGRVSSAGKPPSLPSRSHTRYVLVDEKANPASARVDSTALQQSQSQLNQPLLWPLLRSGSNVDMKPHPDDGGRSRSRGVSRGTDTAPPHSAQRSSRAGSGSSRPAAGRSSHRSSRPDGDETSRVVDARKTHLPADTQPLIFTDRSRPGYAASIPAELDVERWPATQQQQPGSDPSSATSASFSQASSSTSPEPLTATADPYAYPFPTKPDHHQPQLDDNTHGRPYSFPSAHYFPPPPPEGDDYGHDATFFDGEWQQDEGEWQHGHEEDEEGHGWMRHTSAYDGGMCLACLANGGGFYGENVPLEERLPR